MNHKTASGQASSTSLPNALFHNRTIKTIVIATVSIVAIATHTIEAHTVNSATYGKALCGWVGTPSAYLQIDASSQGVGIAGMTEDRALWSIGNSLIP